MDGGYYKYGYGYGVLESEAGLGADLRRVFALIGRRFVVIIVAFLAMFLTSVFRIISMEPYYVSTVKISFTSSRPKQMDIYMSRRPIADYAYLNPLFLKNQIEILKSDRILRKVVYALKLVSPDEKPDSENVNFHIRRLRSMISAEPIENTSIMKITVTAGSAEEAYRIADTVSAIFVKDNLQRMVEGQQANLMWLTEQLSDLERKLEDAQRAVIDFVKKEKLTIYGDNEAEVKDVNIAEAYDESGVIARLRQEKLDVELKLARLRQRYLDKHPKIIAAKNELRDISKKLKAEEDRLKAERKKIESRIISSKEKQIKYDILQGKVKNYKQIYNTMVRKLKEMDIGSSVIQNNAVIIEKARKPLSPAGPNIKRWILYGFIASLMFSFGLAVVIDYLDDSVRNAEEAESFFNLPVLASIPKVKQVSNESSENESIPLLVTDEEDTVLREAFRTLRTNLKFSTAAKKPQSVLVTSTKKGEGKSTIAANLGVVCAEADKKVIIVDCDLRIPCVHRYFNRNNDKGLTNFLAEETPLEDLIQATDIPSLDLLTSGPKSPKPTVLLESDGMRQLISQLAEIYDMVILDAPPVGMVIDTAVIASMVQGIVMVLEAASTSRHALKRALKQLYKAEAQVHGIVMNKVRLNKKAYLNYYGYYYRERA